MRGAYDQGKRLSDAAWRTGRGLTCLAVLLLALWGCASSPSGPSVGARSPVSVTPQRDWSDAVLYFVIVDRFADGSGANDTNVDRANPGGFHGGDLVGLTAQLDEIASLGATAIWITPVPRQIDYCPPAQAPPGVPVPAAGSSTAPSTATGRTTTSCSTRVSAPKRS